MAQRRQQLLAGGGGSVGSASSAGYDSGGFDSGSEVDEAGTSAPSLSLRRLHIHSGDVAGEHMHLERSLAHSPMVNPAATRNGKQARSRRLMRLADARRRKLLGGVGDSDDCSDADRYDSGASSPTSTTAASDGLTRVQRLQRLRQRAEARGIDALSPARGTHDNGNGHVSPSTEPRQGVSGTQEVALPRAARLRRLRELRMKQASNAATATATEELAREEGVPLATPHGDATSGGDEMAEATESRAERLRRLRQRKQQLEQAGTSPTADARMDAGSGDAHHGVAGEDDSQVSHTESELGGDWFEYRDRRSGRSFFYNKTTGKKTWRRPGSAVVRDAVKVRRASLAVLPSYQPSEGEHMPARYDANDNESPSGVADGGGDASSGTQDLSEGSDGGDASRYTTQAGAGVARELQSVALHHEHGRRTSPAAGDGHAAPDSDGGSVARDVDNGDEDNPAADGSLRRPPRRMMSATDLASVLQQVKANLRTVDPVAVAKHKPRRRSQLDVALGSGMMLPGLQVHAWWSAHVHDVFQAPLNSLQPCVGDGC